MIVQAMTRSVDRARDAAHVALALAQELAECVERLRSYKPADAQSSSLRAAWVRLREHVDGQMEREKRLLHLKGQLAVLLKTVRNSQALDSRRRQTTADDLAHVADEKLIDLAMERRRRSRVRDPIAKCISDVNAICAVVEADNASCRANLYAVNGVMDGGLIEIGEP